MFCVKYYNLCTTTWSTTFCQILDELFCQWPSFQLHQQYFTEETSTHKLISIQTYLAKRNLYMKPLCSSHRKEYAMCCRKCFSLICQNCSVDSKCTPETSKESSECDEKGLINTQSTVQIFCLAFQFAFWCCITNFVKNHVMQALMNVCITKSSFITHSLLFPPTRTKLR